MARRRVSFKVAPGVRISASSRGIRTSIGNNSGRVSFGAGGTYTSAKVGGVRISQQHSSATRRSPNGASRSNAAQQHQRAQRAAALELQISELHRIERELTTLHLEEFPPARPPHVAPPETIDVDRLSDQWQKEAAKKINFFKRSARQAARREADQAARAEAATIEAANQQEYQRRQAAVDTLWESLLAHEPHAVIATLEEGFADNIHQATCTDAGVEAGRRYATVVIVFGPASALPDRMPSTTPTGKPTTKKRTKTDQNAFYVKALGSTVLATVKEAFALAPSLEEVRTLVLRRDPTALTPAEHLTAIYSAEFDRERLEALAWNRIDPAEQLLAATEAKFQRKGAAKEVVAILTDDEQTQGLIKAFAAALLEDL